MTELCFLHYSNIIVLIIMNICIYINISFLIGHLNINKAIVSFLFYFVLCLLILCCEEIIVQHS